ncbi:MAG: L,D-transpeptidase family protein [bacterium]|nr:L,D-transpeptidase family protein [bacterium]
MEELKKYIKDAREAGFPAGRVESELQKVGWQKADIARALKEFGDMTEESSSGQNTAKKRGQTLLYFFAAAIILLLAAVSYLLYSRFNLENTNSAKVQNFYSRLAESQVSFTDAGELVFPDEQKFSTRKAEYIENKASFIEVDLRSMELAVYENGVASLTVPVLTKGKEKSWWETPTGDYTALGKSVNAYSSIGEVWMPYSIQFYGNYFIHGWPHYDNGEPVPPGYSGGCIRLSNEDAKAVFQFVKIGMPILVLEAETNRVLSTFNNSNVKDAVLPKVSAKSFFVSDISTGEIILEKNADSKTSVSSLTGLMTAVVAHEIIYLGRSIKVTPNMAANIAQVFYPKSGDNYIGMDLLYPLLMQPSSNAAKILSGFVGEGTFVKNMNIKADSLNMRDTYFADSSGVSSENISTARDITKLLQYVYFKRSFLFDISKGIVFDRVGLIRIGDTIKTDNLKNFNDFTDNRDLIGVKGGEGESFSGVLATVWQIHTQNGDLPVSVVVLDSEDRKKDTEDLLKWLKDNYEVVR